MRRSRRGPGRWARFGLIAAVSTCLAACGSGDEASEPAAWTLRYRLQGGVAEFDVSFRLDANGEAVYRRRNPDPAARRLQLLAAEVAAVRLAVEASGFMELGEAYLAEVGVENAFTYEISWSSPGRSHRVHATDGAILPAPFVELRDMIATLQRRVLAEGVVLREER